MRSTTIEGFALPAARPAKVGLVGRLIARIRAARMRAEILALDPRQRADAGLAAAPAAPLGDAFRLPPEPLWSLDLTPMPRGVPRR